MAISVSTSSNLREKVGSSEIFCLDTDANRTYIRRPEDFLDIF